MYANDQLWRLRVYLLHPFCPLPNLLLYRIPHLRQELSAPSFGGGRGLCFHLEMIEIYFRYVHITFWHIWRTSYSQLIYPGKIINSQSYRNQLLYFEFENLGEITVYWPRIREVNRKHADLRQNKHTLHLFLQFWKKNRCVDWYKCMFRLYQSFDWNPEADCSRRVYRWMQYTCFGEVLIGFGF